MSHDVGEKDQEKRKIEEERPRQEERPPRLVSQDEAEEHHPHQGEYPATAQALVDDVRKTERSR